MNNIFEIHDTDMCICFEIVNRRWKQRNKLAAWIRFAIYFAVSFAIPVATIMLATKINW